MAIKEKTRRRREIDLGGPDGNAFMILSVAAKFAKQLKEVDPDRYNIKRITAEMTSGDYENLIQVFDSYFGDYVDLMR